MAASLEIMIPKHRNRAVLSLAIALALTGLLVFLALRIEGFRASDRQLALLAFLYFGCWAAWLAVSFNFAKAKGYGSEMVGGIFVFLLIASVCFPVLPVILPGIVIFGLKDKTRTRMGRHSR